MKYILNVINILVYINSASNNTSSASVMLVVYTSSASVMQVFKCQYSHLFGGHETYFDPPLSRYLTLIE